MERRHIVARGRVQGVWYRETVRRAAERHAVTGWIRNRIDGSVEAVFEGAADDVERLLEVARLGPPGARVDRLDVSSEPVEGLREFLVVG